MAKKNNQDFNSRLMSCVDESYKRLAPYSQARSDSLSQYTGDEYPDDGSMTTTPVNFLNMAVSIYVQQLSSQMPRAQVKTDDDNIKGDAEMLKLAINKVASNMKLGRTLRGVVLDAMFSMGIVKVGATTKGNDTKYGVFVDRVNFDDFVVDMTANSWREVEFIGNKYKVSLDDLQGNKGYDKDVVKSLSDKASRAEDDLSTTHPDSWEEQKDSSQGLSSLYKMVTLWDIYVYRENKIYTFADDFDRSKPLVVKDIDESLGCPYKILSFNEVPGSIIPVAPSMYLKGLHDLENSLYRKMSDQSNRQKTITAVTNGSETDGMNVKDSSDGEMIPMQDPRSVQQLSYGGVDGNTMSFSMHIRELYSYLNGNLDTLGGLSAQTGTVGQEELLSESASKLVSKMQTKVDELAADVLGSIAAYLWLDKSLEIDVLMPVSDIGMDIPLVHSSKNKNHGIDKYDINIVPYSMQQENPSAKIKTLTEIWNTYIAPNIQFMAQQGISVNYRELFETIYQYTGMDELGDLLNLKFDDEIMETAMSSAGQRQLQSPNTTRTNVRRNVSTGGTMAARENQQIKASMSNQNNTQTKNTQG